MKRAKMSEIILCRGLPASGKSTWAKEKLAELRAGGVFATRVCRDDIRLACFGDTFPGYEAEESITKMRDAMIRATLERGGTVIVDECLIRPKYIKALVAIANDFGATKTLEDFTHVTAETCFKQNEGRPGEVPAEVIIRMAQTLKSNKNVDALLAEDNSTAAKFPKVIQDPDKYNAIVVDIDGTLAHMNDRSPYDWSKVGEDSLDDTIAELIRSQKEYHAGFKEVILLSGRDGSSRELTEKWLSDHSVDYDQLFMRAPGDQRKDDLVKYELFIEHILPNYYVEFVLDDRDQVVKMWREIGLKCFQVAEGNF